MRKLLILALCFLLLLSGCRAAPTGDRPLIVAVNFPAYDFARAVAGDRAEIVMLIPPGADAHSFEPSPADMRAIKNCDIFIYTGGESDTWLDDILRSEGDSRAVVNMLISSGTAPIIDKITDGHHHDHEIDEHVWLAPDKAVLILKSICNALIGADAQNEEYYRENCEGYCGAITAEAAATKDALRKAEHRTICVADRFAYKYLCDYYALSYVAAFSSCDSFADADAQTVARLIDRVRDGEFSYVFYNNGGSSALADLVCAETGAEKLTLHSVEAVTKEQFEDGITYLDIMKQNDNAIKRGLGLYVVD